MKNQTITKAKNSQQELRMKINKGIKKRIEVNKMTERIRITWG
jgi:hypothetical protein